MRTHLYRGVVALAVALVFSAPAFAQGIVKGKVVDERGQPVADAKVTIQGPARNAETKTNNKGEFVQVGLQSGAYTVTVTKEKLIAAQKVNVTQGTPAEANMTLVPQATAGMSPEQKAIQEAAGAAIEALRAGRDDEAITKLNDVVGKLPTCSDCYYNLGLAYTHKQQWAEAEAALKKSIELKPTNPDPYNGLANVYNAQKRFDEALAMNQKATELSGSTAGAGGGNAEAIYNQGVVLFNAGKYADAKTQFENATKADPNNANAFYQLGMTDLNLGQIPDAVAALETFMKLAPNDPKAAQVQGSLPALQQMIKK
ncbi:MAG TPA: tetratricopeptide repeat protein [Vicinamibacterales bacterium]|nr:tetratricopeptide repeat protein [Vicinamibacterales bacterium]